MRADTVRADPALITDGVATEAISANTAAPPARRTRDGIVRGKNIDCLVFENEGQWSRSKA